MPQLTFETIVKYRQINNNILANTSLPTHECSVFLFLSISFLTRIRCYNMSLTFLHWKPLLAIFPGSGFNSFLKSSEVHPNISYMVRKRHTSPNHLVAPIPAGTDVQKHKHFSSQWLISDSDAYQWKKADVLYRSLIQCLICFPRVFHNIHWAWGEKMFSLIVKWLSEHPPFSLIFPVSFYNHPKLTYSTAFLKLWCLSISKLPQAGDYSEVWCNSRPVT